jgi:hypothetical protein
MASTPTQWGEKENRDALVAALIEHFSRQDGDQEHLWAFETVYDLVDDNPEVAWPIIVQSVKECPSDYVLACIAAGPLEGLLCDHGPSFIDRVLAEAGRDPRFRKCLRAVWGCNRMDKDVWARVNEAVKDIPPW